MFETSLVTWKQKLLTWKYYLYLENIALYPSDYFRDGTRVSKIQSGEDVDVLRSPSLCPIFGISSCPSLVIYSSHDSNRSKGFVTSVKGQETERDFNFV